ncbi:MAG: hypothetical protein NC213_10225, partial [Acetobacter sp.]|nr:hypothetical protein [Bacteroides sp.]MCM1342110.1 hypothetical protein [Acetobacter sp.]MCM1434329.1 hypothetical protein [Clostridiales bacterium]
MAVIKFKVSSTDVIITEKSDKLTSGNVNRIKCIFELSEDFDDLEVRAVFNGVACTVVNGECYAPELAKGRCIIGVYGYSIDNGKVVERVSPAPCAENVYSGSYKGNEVDSQNPAPTELEEFYQRISALIKNMNSESIADNSVTTPKLADGAVTADKLASDAGDGLDITNSILTVESDSEQQEITL